MNKLERPHQGKEQTLQCDVLNGMNATAYPINMNLISTCQLQKSVRNVFIFQLPDTRNVHAGITLVFPEGCLLRSYWIAQPTTCNIFGARIPYAIRVTHIHWNYLVELKIGRAHV